MYSSAAEVLEKTKPKQRPIVGAGQSSNSIIRYFPRVFMGLGHKGLSALAKDNGIDIKKLDQGEFLAFVNTPQTAVKVFTSNNLIGYLKMPGSKKLTPEVIASIPTLFSGESFKFSNKVKLSMRTEFRVFS